jgi:hypothetical protein
MADESTVKAGNTSSHPLRKRFTSLPGRSPDSGARFKNSFGKKNRSPGFTKNHKKMKNPSVFDKKNKF